MLFQECFYNVFCLQNPITAALFQGQFITNPFTGSLLLLAYTLSLQVDAVASSLKPGGVYMLDAGSDIFLWNGPRSSLMTRSKARLMAEKIRKFERKNKSTIHQMRAGLEEEAFWEILGGPEDVEGEEEGEEEEEEEEGQATAVSVAGNNQRLHVHIIIAW